LVFERIGFPGKLTVKLQGLTGVDHFPVQNGKKSRRDKKSTEKKRRAVDNIVQENP